MSVELGPGSLAVRGVIDDTTIDLVLGALDFYCERRSPDLTLDLVQVRGLSDDALKRLFTYKYDHEARGHVLAVFAPAHLAGRLAVCHATAHLGPSTPRATPPRPTGTTTHPPPTQLT